jgi:hypothetical protein
MITDPIVKYWGHGILWPTVRGFSHSGLASTMAKAPLNHGSTDRLRPPVYTRSYLVGFRISLTMPAPTSLGGEFPSRHAP